MQTEDYRPRLTHDLRVVAERLPRNCYRQAGDKDERTYQTLARVVKAIAGEQAWRESPTLALINVLRKAIGNLPEQMSARSPEDPPEGRPERVRRNKWAGAPECHMAEIMYGFRDDEVPARLNEDGSEAPRTYKKDYLPAAMRLAKATKWPERIRGKMTQIIRQDLADRLLVMKREAIERRQLSEPAAGDADEVRQVLIDRKEYLDALHTYVRSGRLILCIWGEPGTGKTTLAQQFARTLCGKNSVTIIRAADQDVLRQDLVDALIAEGLEPTNWSDEYSRATLRRKIAESPKSGVVIIDNVDDEGLIWQLTPKQPKVPIIITMRRRPQSRQIVCEELHNFTEAQACEFIQRHLSQQAKADILALSETLGYRPLALEHAVLFIKESPDIELPDLIRLLAKNVTDAILTLTPPEQPQRNLVELYKIILAELLNYDAGRLVLDTFLAVAGQSGLINRELVWVFMRSPLGGSHDRPHFRAGLRMLAKRGLLREDDGHGHASYLSMHSLTYRILRDLRGDEPLKIEADYLTFLQTTSIMWGDDGEENDIATMGKVDAWFLQQSARIIRNYLPEGWLSFHLIDEGTWVSVRQSSDDTGTSKTYVVRYERHPNTIYKIDYRTGESSPLTADEWRQFFTLVCIFYERNAPELLWLKELGDDDDWNSHPEESEGRLDSEVTKADGCNHLLIDPWSKQECIDRDWPVLALCGKRYVPAPSSPSKICPDCERMGAAAPERWAEIESAMGRFLRRIDIDAPFRSAYLYFIRGRVRRWLEKYDQATNDLMLASSFLSIAMDSSDPPDSMFGEGVLKEILALPDPPKERAVSVCNTILMMKDLDIPRKGRVLDVRSRLLHKNSQFEDALVGYNEIVSLVDTEALDSNTIEFGKMLLGKQVSERRLGRVTDANNTMRRVIAEAEKRSARDNGRWLVDVLLLSGRYLLPAEPCAARADLQRAIDVARSHGLQDHEQVWRCFMLLAHTHRVLDNLTDALDAAEAGLRIVDEHMSTRSDLREKALQIIQQIKEKGASGNVS